MRDEYFNPKETPITYILVAINIITFVVLEIMGDTTDGLFMLLNGAMNPNKVLAEGEWYRLLTAFILAWSDFRASSGASALFRNLFRVRTYWLFFVILFYVFDGKK